MPTPTEPSSSARGWPLFCRGTRWFRIKGYGIRYVDHRRHPMMFSERNGYRCAIHVGPHCFALLRPSRQPKGAPADDSENTELDIAYLYGDPRR